MGKLLLFLLAAVAIYWWVSKKRSSQEEQSRDPKIETMVKCAYCGLHIPLNESVSDQGQHYCDEEHRRLGNGTRRG